MSVLLWIAVTFCNCYFLSHFARMSGSQARSGRQNISPLPLLYATLATVAGFAAASWNSPAPARGTMPVPHGHHSSHHTGDPDRRHIISSLPIGTSVLASDDCICICISILRALPLVYEPYLVRNVAHDPLPLCLRTFDTYLMRTFDTTPGDNWITED